MTRTTRKNPRQSILGARARRLEELLAAHRLTLGHAQAMDLLAKLDGHRTRHTSPEANALPPNANTSTTPQRLTTVKAIYEGSQARIDHVFPDLGRAIREAMGLTPRAASASEALATLGTPVAAETHDDRRVYKARFDARPFLAQASVDEVRGLIECGWRGDYPADRVAEHMAEEMGDDEVRAVLDYATRLVDNGFECVVEASQAVAWLRDHRPETLAQALAETKMDTSDLAEE